MGSSSSTPQQSLTNIGRYHNQINVSSQKIVNKAAFISQTIKERGYNDKDMICSRIVWQNYDELLSFFPITTLNNIRYKAGVVPQNTGPLNRVKLQTCLNISVLYQKKLNLINNILQELPNCLNMEQAIFQDLSTRLQSENANTEKWLTIYQKLESFNQDIKKRYDLIDRQLDSVREAKTIAQIDGVARTTNSILSETNTICKNYENDLITYSKKATSAPQKPLPSLPAQ